MFPGSEYFKDEDHAELKSNSGECSAIFKNMY